jgi:hypothetical protein
VGFFMTEKTYNLTASATPHSDSYNKAPKAYSQKTTTRGVTSPGSCKRLVAI